MHRCVFVVASAGLVVSAHGQSSRYWVEPVIGPWDDAGNWSLTDGGPPGGGLPQSGDIALISNRSLIVFDGPGVPGAIFDSVVMRGVGSGTTELLHTAGTLATDIIFIGSQGVDNQYRISGGQLNATNCIVGFVPTGGGYLEVSSAGSVLASNLQVGGAEGDGFLNITDGSIDTGGLWLSVRSASGAQQGGPALLQQLGGTIDATEFLVGRNGQATAEMRIGQTTVTGDTIVGMRSDDASQLNVYSGADVDVTGTITVGDDTFGTGHGQLNMTGGTVDADTLLVGNGDGSTGRVDLLAGTLTVNTARVGLGGTATIDLNSGAINAGQTFLGEASNVPFVVPPGTLTIDGGTYAGVTMGLGTVADGLGRLFITDGTLNLMTLNVGAVADGAGNVTIGGFGAGGTINATTINVGVDGFGDVFQTSGTVDADTLNIGGANEDTQYELLGGTLLADVINVMPSNGNISEELRMSGAFAQGFELNIFPGAAASIVDSGIMDARFPDVVNDGSFRFDSSDTILSSAVILGTRLLGRFVNNGDLRYTSFSASTADSFMMNLDNHGTFDVQPLDLAIIVGRLVNLPTGEISVTGGNIGYLECRSPIGINNEGLMTLDDGLVHVPNGSLTNNGTLRGFGRITAPVVNNASLLPDPVEIANDLICEQGYACGAGSSTRFLITNSGNNRVLVLNNDAVLGGTLNVAFAPDVPLPARGTEFELIACDTGMISGVFASEAILGFPCEIVYEPTRVVARSLRCGPADVAAPFGTLNIDDVDGFVAAFLAPDLLADCDGNGFLNIDDIDCFVADFLAGCP